MLPNKKNILELESKDIIKIYDKIMNLKMLNIKESKNIKSLKEFTKLNKVNK